MLHTDLQVAVRAEAYSWMDEAAQASSVDLSAGVAVLGQHLKDNEGKNRAA